MLTENQLRQIMPNLSAAKAASFLPHLNDAMTEYGTNRCCAPRRSLRSSRTSRASSAGWKRSGGRRRRRAATSQPTDLAQRLGNTETGRRPALQGARADPAHRPRQLPSASAGLLGIDLVAAPALAAAPEARVREPRACSGRRMRAERTGRRGGLPRRSRAASTAGSTGSPIGSCTSTGRRPCSRPASRR